ncbi:MAG: aminoacetone oxidase family FAD-binding enzyme, partial [Acidobacteriaceae bacterium]|nr:aminoacetone oxidase family FAD-binding enzyme [Acidobacteriaceae bacterium]
RPSSPRPDVLIVGAGAAGLATAIFTRQLNPSISVTLLDGSARPGAKILVSGGSRCNVTNVHVSERDYWGGHPAFIRRVLRALTVPDTVAAFARLGVTLHEEHDGKLFPDSNRSRDVLNALLGECQRLGVTLLGSHLVTAVARHDDGFSVHTSATVLHARRLVLATGGRALPKSGSDGAGYAFARALGHTIVPTTPALAPLVLDRNDNVHRHLSGVSHDAELTLWVDGKSVIRLSGALLWTHFGMSGPVALNMSRHWARAQLGGRAPTLTVNVCPGRTFDAVDRWLVESAAARPRASLVTLLDTVLPASVATAMTEQAGVTGSHIGAQLSRDARRSLVHTLTAWQAPVTGTRGYTYAEATAGGVAVDDIDAGTMESKICRGLYLVGEVLDVDGRLGGFNFQWAWSSARAAARALSQ